VEHPNRDRLDDLFRGDAYARGLGAEVLTWDGGTATVRFTPTASHHNFGAITHGGAVFSVGDIAFSVASNSWGRRAVALTIDTHFLAAAPTDEPITATAVERSRTRRTASYLIDVRADDDRPVASLHAMVYRLDAWFFGDEAWPASWRESH